MGGRRYVAVWGMLLSIVPLARLAAADTSDIGPCDSWQQESDFNGYALTSVEVATRDQCLPLCEAIPGCTAMSFTEAMSTCIMKGPPEDVLPERSLGVATFRLCPEDEKPADCGTWIDSQDYFGSDLVNRRADSQAECLSHCMSTPHCNAMTFDGHVDPAICYMKNLLDDHLRTWQPTWPISSYKLCPDQTATAPGPAMSPGPPLAGALPGTSTRVRGTTVAAAPKDECSGPDCEAATSDSSSGSLSDGVIAAIASGGALLLLLSVSWVLCLYYNYKRYRKAQRNKGSQSFDATLLSSGTATGSRSGRSQAVPPYLIMNPLHSNSMTDQSSVPSSARSYPATSPALLLHNSHPLQTANLSKFNTDASGCGTPKELHLSQYGSTWDVPTLPPPQVGASKDTCMEFVHNQLDRMEAAAAGRLSEVLDGLVLNGGGPRDRLQGGQAIVQMAYSRVTREQWAIKFFIFQESFELEKELYTGDNPLGQFLPQVRNIVDNKDCRVVDPAGHALPACIVMEAGESLDLWSARNAPDRAQAFCVVYHIAQRLAELHAARFVHRDLKPGNVMWLPRRNRWTLIDFGCAATIGEQAALGYTLRYAAPEVVTALRHDKKDMRVLESQDTWSLGVMAFELATGSKTFPLGMPPEQIMDQIEGRHGALLPWEGERLTERVKSQLRLFQGALLQLLHRDPLQRPSMAQFCRTCSHMLGGVSQ